MIPWIQVYSNLIHHPKVTKLADKLELKSKDANPNAIAAGMLVSLWLWAAQNATDGDLSECSDRAIAEAAGFKRKPSLFVEALIHARLLDEGRKLHNWDEYATLLIDCDNQRRENTRKRVEKHRNKKKAQQTASSNSDPAVDCAVTTGLDASNCNASCNVTETLSNAPTLPNITIPYQTLKNIDTGAADGDARASEQELAMIGLKKGEFIISKDRVLRTVAETIRLFGCFRPGDKPTALDRRMVFLCSNEEGSAELLDYAFEQAQMVQKERDWRYIGGVIKTLRSRNITSLEQAREWDEERPDQTGHEQEWIEGNQKHNDMLKRIREDGL